MAPRGGDAGGGSVAVVAPPQGEAGGGGEHQQREGERRTELPRGAAALVLGVLLRERTRESSREPGRAGQWGSSRVPRSGVWLPCFR